MIAEGSLRGGGTYAGLPSDVLFLETSALTGEGVADVFVRIARLILSKIEDGTSRSPQPQQKQQLLRLLQMQ